MTPLGTCASALARGKRLLGLVLLLSPAIAVPRLRAEIPEPGEAELLGTYFDSPLWDAGRHKTFDFAGVSARALWPLSFGPFHDQRWDLVGELLFTHGVRGFDSGGVMAGPAAGLRFWLLPKADTVSSYVQATTGPVYSSAYRDRGQNELGEALEFKSTFAVGGRLRLSSEWSGIAETSLSHISDAGLSSRNCGVNALGLSLGFERRW